MSSTSPGAGPPHHHLRRMVGRDRLEAHRVATPLELLFDATFAVSFGGVTSELARALTRGYYAVACLGFALASFGICWAWTSFCPFDARTGAAPRRRCS